MGTSKPYYRPLTDEDAQLIDENARAILKETGIRIDSIHYLDRLKKAGAEVDYNAMSARFSGNWLDCTLARAPGSFEMFSRDGKNDLEVGAGKVYFGNGGRVSQILDMFTGGYRQTLLRDIINTATLVQNLDNINFYIIACQAHDVSPETYHIRDFFEAFNHTTKHVMGGCDDIKGAKQMHRTACIVAGNEKELRARPFVSVITNPISPLSIDANTMEIIDFCTSKNIPLTCATAPIAGATAPITLAGTLSQMHAEALACVAVIQSLSPGARALYGTFPTVMDMKTMEVSMGCVEMGMMNSAAVQLAKLYNLPIYASGGVTEAKRPDIQAGFEKNFSNLTVAMIGADIIHLTAGLLDSAKSISYEQFVIDDENIAMIHRILKGIDINHDTLAYDNIKRVAHDGNYLMEEHTVKHLDQFYYPRLSDRCNFDVWEKNQRPSMLKRAREFVGQILYDNRESLLEVEIIEEIETILT